MNVQKYISSGILEQYVLGELSSKEQSEVEQYAKQFPTIQKELDAIDAALFEAAKSNSISPKLSEDTILDLIDDIDNDT